MPETIKASIIILFLGSLILQFNKGLLPKTISINEYNLWRFLWVASTIIAFFSFNYWLSIFLLIVLIKIKATTPSNKSTQFLNYLWLLPLLPLLAKDIPGFMGINFLFGLNHPRLLSILLLFPLFLSNTNKKTAFLRLSGDKLFALYLLIIIIITSRNGNITNILRSNFYIFIDIFLPYYAASRALSTLKDLKKVAFILFCTASLFALIGIFESLKVWQLYASLNNSLDLGHHASAYLFRNNSLRVSGPFSHSIVLGYFISIGITMGLAIKSSFKNPQRSIIVFTILILGLLLTLSRGPWIGTLVSVALFMFLTQPAIKLIKNVAALVIISTPITLFTSFGQKIIGLLPFINDSNTATGTVTYRQELFKNAWIVIQRHPLLGSNTYLDTPEMQSMIQGQGIIDIVNSYLRLALNSGLLGVGVFCLFFLTLLIHLYHSQQKAKKISSEAHMLGAGLLATMISILLIIATVSSIDIVSELYWLLAGICVAYLNIIKLTPTK